MTFMLIFLVLVTIFSAIGLTGARPNTMEWEHWSQATLASSLLLSAYIVLFVACTVASLVA